MVLPGCQDTGTAIIMGKKGQRVWTDGNDEEHLSRGVYDTYVKRNLRYSQVAPQTMFEEKNTGSNLPAQIDIYAKDGEEYHFHMMVRHVSRQCFPSARAGRSIRRRRTHASDRVSPRPRRVSPSPQTASLQLPRSIRTQAKGGGSANKTFLYQETKALLNPERMVQFLEEKIKTLGTAACPPYHLAFVVGGLSAEQNLKTVKMASARYYDDLPTTGNARGRAFRDVADGETDQRADARDGHRRAVRRKVLCHDVRVDSSASSRRVVSRWVWACRARADRQINGKITADGVFWSSSRRTRGSTCPDQGRGTWTTAG